MFVFASFSDVSSDIIIAKEENSVICGNETWRTKHLVNDFIVCLYKFFVWRDNNQNKLFLSFLFQYSVWNVLWLAWNAFLICFYLNVGILDSRVSMKLFRNSFKTLGIVQLERKHYRFDLRFGRVENQKRQSENVFKFSVRDFWGFDDESGSSRYASPHVMQLCFLIPFLSTCVN